MKPVNGGLGARELFLQASKKQWRHIADNLENIFRITTVFLQKLLECPNSSFTLTWSDENDGFILSAQVNKNRDLIMTSLGSRLIKTKGRQVIE